MLIDGPTTARSNLVLAHGAGAPSDSPFMEVIAKGLADCGLRVARFDFPYMQRRRQSGKKSPPDRAPVLLQAWRDAIAELKSSGGIQTDRSLVIGGKSMGGRMASLLADEIAADGLVCLGYPFHPTGKPQQLRTEHLEALRTPTLILQGERDPFGRVEEVADYALSSAIRLQWLKDGDHSFKPRKASGRTEQENLQQAIEAIAQFVKGLNPRGQCSK